LISSISKCSKFGGFHSKPWLRVSVTQDPSGLCWVLLAQVLAQAAGPCQVTPLDSG
jgi:hypothetical protein